MAGPRLGDAESMPGRQPSGSGTTASRCAPWSQARERARALAAALRTSTRRLIHEHTDPVQLGVAVGLGVLIGCSPFLGVQTLVGLGLAWILRLNRVAVLLGLQISVPPLTAFVLFADAQVGALSLRGQWLPLSVEAMRAVRSFRDVADLLGVLVLGGAIVGAVLAVVTGLTTTFVIRRWRRAPRPA